MSVVLQVNFSPSPSQERQSADEKLESAHSIARVPGLRWKIWIEDTAPTRGGIYLFDDLPTARAWGDHRLRPKLERAGAANVSLRYFDVNEDISLVTRAPLSAHEIA